MRTVWDMSYRPGRDHERPWFVYRPECEHETGCECRSFRFRSNALAFATERWGES